MRTWYVREKNGKYYAYSLIDDNVATMKHLGTSTSFTKIMSDVEEDYTKYNSKGKLDVDVMLP